MENFSYNKTLNIFFSEHHNYINDSLDEILILANLKDYRISIREAYSDEITKILLAEVVIENNNQYFSLSFYFNPYKGEEQDIYLFNNELYIYDSNHRITHFKSTNNKLKKIKEML